MEIYLIRHGTTQWNTEFRLQGKTDTSLDLLGIEMARETGIAFRELGITFDRVYSSPLKRAYRTAELAVGSSVDIIPDPRLEELGFGSQEGRRIMELGEDEKIPFRYFKDDPALYDRLAPDVGAESLKALCGRTADFLREVVEQPHDQVRRILISAHGACNKGLLMHIRNSSDLSEFWAGGLQKNCGVDIIEYDPESRIYQVKETGRTFYPAGLSKNFRNLL